MMLHLIGICHPDTHGRRNLADKLKELAAIYGGPPSFVAVEWAADYFADVKAQRARFRDLTREAWDIRSDEVLDALMMSLGYEGDTHEDVFAGYPSGCVVWLDQERPDRDAPRVKAAVRGFAADRLCTYQEWLQRDPSQAPDEETLLDRLSTVAWDISDRYGNDPRYERDSQWLGSVLPGIDEAEAGWAIVIVGAVHTQDRVDSAGRQSLCAGLLKASQSRSVPFGVSVHTLRP